jgi:hypothetical protein
MSILISESELRRSRDDEKIVRETAQQVIKDFGLFGMQIDFPNDINWAYDELFNQLETHVSRMLVENDRMLLSLLYQIDVSEKKIHIEAQKRPDKPLHHIVTELILDRELRKVLTRNYFKKENKS